MWPLQSHEQYALEIFPGNNFYSGKKIYSDPLTIVAFTNRSGSNFLCQCLTATGNFVSIQEHLNGTVIQAMAKELQSRTLPDHIGKLREQYDDGRNYALKASWDQLWMLLKWNIPAMFNGLNVIHVVRDDIIGQAVSFSIAEQTHKWSSLDPETNIAPKFDADDIESRIDRIFLENQRIKLLCRFARIDRHVVRYEKLIASPQEGVDILLNNININCISDNFIDFEEVTMERQFDRYNAEFIDNYTKHARAVLKLNI